MEKVAWWRFEFRRWSRDWSLESSRDRRTAAAAIGMDREPELDPTAILRESCTFRAAASVLDPGSGRVLAARFTSLGDHTVVLDLPATADSDEPTSLHPLARCVVTFAHRNRSLVFLSAVRRMEESPTPDRPRQLTLRRPTCLAREDLRCSTRVPTPPGCGLEIDLCDDRGHSWRAAPLDVSLSGALVEMAEPAEPILEMLDEVRLELRLAGESARLSASVRRQDGPRIGLAFVGILRDGNVEPPESVTRIVQALEGRWARIHGPAPTVSSAPV